MAARLMSCLAVTLAVVASLLVAAGASASVAARSGTNRSVLATNHCLVSRRDGRPAPEAERFSPSGVFTLWVAPESVEIDENESLGPDGPDAGTTTWWQFMVPNTGRLPPDRSRLCMRSTGNLSLRTSKGKLVWSSHTAGTGHHNYLTMQDDGDLVMRTAAGKIVWTSGTTRTILPDGSTIASGRHMVNRYRQQFGITPSWLIMRKGGDLVLTQGSKILWQTGTHVRGAYASLLAHGDLEIVAPSGKVLWRSHTHGKPAFLMLSVGCLTFNTRVGTVWRRPDVRACTL